MFHQSSHRPMATRPLPPLLPLPETPPLRGRYRLEAQIGQGRSGVVLRALDLSNGKRCAIKMLRPSHLGAAALRQQFENEARILGLHPHPAIVAAHAFDIDDEGRPFIVMELLRGEDLGSHLRRAHRLPLSKVCQILKHAADALHHLHQHGIVHRNLSPSKLFLGAQEAGADRADPPRIKLLGLGLAQSAAALRSGGTRCDIAADLCGLAATAYELLSGIAPFGKETLAQVLERTGKYAPTPLHLLCADVPEAVSRAIQLAMSKEGSASFHSIVELAKFLHEEAAEATPCSTLTQGRPQPLRPEQLDEIDRTQGRTVQMEAGELEQLRLCSERSGRQSSQPARAPKSPTPPPPSSSLRMLAIGTPLGILLGMLLAYLFLLWRPQHRALPQVAPDPPASREMLAVRPQLPAPPAPIDRRERIVPPLRLADEVD